MACTIALDSLSRIHTSFYYPYRPVQFAEPIYKATRPQTEYRLHLRPIPDAISGWIRGLSVHGQ